MVSRGAAKNRGKFKTQDAERPERKAAVSFGKPRGLSPAGKEILIFMQKMKIKGNFRDYLLFIGNKMYDYSGVYTVNRPNMDEKNDAFVALVHKSKVFSIIGEEAAEHFWSKKLRSRTPRTVQKGEQKIP